MVDTVKQRPNHYDLLGVAQSASRDDIAQAFARELGMLPLRPFGSLAQVSLAYETLRDPVKRAAYDASLRPGAEPAHSLIGRLESSPFIGRASVDQAISPADAMPAPIQQATIPQPRLSPSATELLHRPAEPVQREALAMPARKLEPADRPNPIEAPQTEPINFEATKQPGNSEGASSDWKLPAIAAGALMLAVVLGAWTGWQAGDGNDQAPPDRLAAAQPPAPAPENVEPSTFTPVTSAPEEEPTGQAHQVIAKPRTVRNRAPLNIELPDEVSAELPQADQEQADQAATTDQVMAEAIPVAATSAKMPLPNATIARTIGRIGYACGRVSSTSAIEGDAPGVFKVTCTSGHSYRAAPVRGRYHFRRMAGD